MSNASHTSNESHRSPPRTQSIPSSPEQRDSATFAEVASPTETPSFPLTIVANYEQDSNSDHEPTASLIDLIQDNYPAVSPTSAETILALDPTLNATIRATAYGLAPLCASERPSTLRSSPTPSRKSTDSSESTSSGRKTTDSCELDWASSAFPMALSVTRAKSPLQS